MSFVFIYKADFQVIYWDEQNAYMEHRFISLSDNFINAIAMCKIRFMNCNAEKIFDEFLANGNCPKQKPVIIKPLLKWIESNESSSQYLRSNISIDIMDVS